MAAKDRLLDMAMSKLSSIQREVIQRSYLDDEGEFDFIVCGDLGLSDRTFRRIKSEALNILAAALRVEVYEVGYVEKLYS
ncbi:hypothetical protein ACU1JV_15215 [Paenibacillus sp. T2-29]